jgi:1,4-alpha-glucan branching enzyme
MDPIDRFGVRGCHPTVHEVELPPWLPDYVMKGMVNNFEADLRREIFTMMLDKVKRRKVHRPSDQSTSAASTGSHKNQTILPQNHDHAYGVSNINYTMAVDN